WLSSPNRALKRMAKFIRSLRDQKKMWVMTNLANCPTYAIDNGLFHRTALVKRNGNQRLLPIRGAGAGSQLNRLRPQGGPNLDLHSPVAQVGEGAARGKQSLRLRISLPAAEIIRREVMKSLDTVEDAVSSEVVADAQLNRIANMSPRVHVESELCAS